MELFAAGWGASAGAALEGMLLLGIAGRHTGALAVPIGTQIVIFPPLLWVAEDLVSLVDLLELNLRTRLLLGLDHVRMVFAGKRAESFADVVFGGRLGHPEGFVVVLELNGHICQST